MTHPISRFFRRPTNIPALRTMKQSSLILLLIASAQSVHAQKAAPTVEKKAPEADAKAQPSVVSVEEQVRLLDEQIRALAQKRAALLGTGAREKGPALRLTVLQKADPTGDPKASLALAQGKASPPEKMPQPESTAPFQINGQSTFILQNLFKFHSPYQRDSGGNGGGSLLSRNESELSDTYTLYLGARLSPRVEVYIDPEMTRGHGISNAVGIAGYSNGEVIRNPTLSQDPYLGRYYIHWVVPTGHSETEKVEAAQNQVAGTRPLHRFVVWAGKLGTSDVFDLNSYANSTRTQFMNWALLNNGAYDYAADTRGYTRGIALEWIHPDWAIRFGSFQMPTVANGIDLAGNVADNRGDQLELELHPHGLGKSGPAIVRLLGYRNVAHMGDYRLAVRQAVQNNTTPDITTAARKGNVKYGFGLNFELPLGDEGNTGLFGRYGWDDGATESFAYTEIDRSLSFGTQVSGARWHRPKDRFAVAFVQNDLSSAHRDYLGAGGSGFIIGDGQLNYAPERIVESYYNFHLNRVTTLGIDYQYIVNPGYNADRGPVSIVSGRVHLEF